MDKNLDNVASNLYSQLRTRFPNMELRDENEGIIELGKKINGIPVTEKLARSFIFNFTDNNVPLTSVKIDLSNDNGLIVSYSNEIENNDDVNKEKFFSFLRDLRRSMKSIEPNFTVRVLGKNNLEPRDIGESQMNESKLWGSNKISYQKIGEAKLLIRHSRPVNYDLPAGRTMHIESIHVENSQGERFLYPYKHLNGARALAQHISNGGTSYDAIGQHVIGLSEELSKLRMFKQYVNRNEMISEAMGTIQSKVLERIDEIKKQIHQLQNESYYKKFSESFIVNENKEIPEDVLNDWIDRLTIRTFNEELKNVFPYIYKLVGEETLPIKELTAEDLLPSDETQIEEETPARSLSEIDQYESFLEDVTEGVGLYSQNPQEQEEAIKKLNDLLMDDDALTLDADGLNLKQSFEGIFSDSEITELLDVFKEMGDLELQDQASKTQMVKDVLRDYIQFKDQESGAQILDKINFGEPPVLDQPPAITPAAAPVVPQPAPAAPPADMTAMAPAAPPAAPPADMTAMAPAAPPVAPATQPLTASIDNNPKVGKSIKAVREMLKQLAARGANPSDTVTLKDGREFNLKEITEMAGLTFEDIFDTSKGSKQEIVEFIKSMYDPIAKAFPKGETGVMLAVEKKFGENATPIAERVIGELRVFQESLAMRKLAGLSEDIDFPIDQVLEEATYSAKAARAGKDIGKPGKQFAKISADAAKRYGSKEKGEKVAGAVLKKLRAKEDINEEGEINEDYPYDPYNPYNQYGYRMAPPGAYAPPQGVFYPPPPPRLANRYQPQGYYPPAYPSDSRTYGPYDQYGKGSNRSAPDIIDAIGRNAVPIAGAIKAFTGGSQPSSEPTYKAGSEREVPAPKQNLQSARDLVNKFLSSK